MDKPKCYLCNITIRRNMKQFTFHDDDGDVQTICRPCSLNYDRCEDCDTLTSYRVTLNRRYNVDLEICYRCAIEEYICMRCEEFWDGLANFSDYCENCYTCDCYECGCEYCYGGDVCGDCYECSDGPDTESDWVHQYSYKPTPIFHNSKNEYGSVEPLPLEPYLGMELEINIDDYDEGAALVTQAKPNLIYCKNDASVDGFEMVTHPMTLQAAKDILPFDELRVLRNSFRASAWNNGIHVHVSRSGFTDNAHVFRWFKLIYRNAVDVRRIARRDSEEWASFRTTERRNHKHTAEKRKGRGTRSVMTNRYSAINVENDETFEVRVFRGSLRRDEILASLELVHASVEYTRQLTTNQIAQHNGWNWTQFIEWAQAQGDTYAELIALNTKTQPKPEQLELTLNEMDTDPIPAVESVGLANVVSNTDNLYAYTIRASDLVPSGTFYNSSLYLHEQET